MQAVGLEPWWILEMWVQGHEIGSHGFRAGFFNQHQLATLSLQYMDTAFTCIPPPLGLSLSGLCPSLFL